MDTPSLCGRVRVRQGWDLEARITEHHLTHACQKCVALYRAIPLRPELYRRAYAILIELADAPLDAKDDFVRHFAESDEPTREWRFQGKFGFGGKFRRSPTGHEITCYPEDLDRLGDLLLIVNQRLAALTLEFQPTVAPRAT